jgi:hypothetical protein
LFRRNERRLGVEAYQPRVYKSLVPASTPNILGITHYIWPILFARVLVRSIMHVANGIGGRISFVAMGVVKVLVDLLLLRRHELTIMFAING